MSLNLKKYQQYILGSLASIILLLFGFAILAISLFQANRKSAVSIKEITTGVIKVYKGK